MTTHRPGRKAGAVDALVDGEPVIYVERGGKSLLAWPTADERLNAAALALASAAESIGTGRAPITKVNCTALASHAEVVRALTQAGFVATPRGVRLPRATAG